MTGIHDNFGKLEMINLISLSAAEAFCVEHSLNFNPTYLIIQGISTEMIGQAWIF